MKKCRYKRACIADQFALQQCFVVLNMAFCISSWLFICPVACAVVGFKDPDVEEVEFGGLAIFCVPILRVNVGFFNGGYLA